MHFWNLTFSYLVTPKDGHSCRENGRCGVVAGTIEDAIELAKRTIPPGTSEPKIWSVSHRGLVDVVQERT